MASLAEVVFWLIGANTSIIKNNNKLISKMSKKIT
jgi:hypothetical protein